MKFLFDVDGTLTPSRYNIDPVFHTEFFDFCTTHDVYLVTGSDKSKTLEQLGPVLYNMCKRVYNCSGNEVWEGNILVRQSEWTLDDNVRSTLNRALVSSKFHIRTGNHIEERPGIINFSVVGRNADRDQRAQYVKFDLETNERQRIAEEFNVLYPELEARVGGETGLDIGPKGTGKEQVLVDFDKTDTLVYFGDACYPGGNDFEIAQSIVDNYSGRVHNVTDWKQTQELIRGYSRND